MSNKRTVENYSDWFENLSKVYQESLRSSVRQASISFFDKVERAALYYSLDELKEALVFFIDSQNSAEPIKRINLLGEPFWYNNRNPYQLIRQAFRVRLQELMMLNRLAKKLRAKTDAAKILFAFLAAVPVVPFCLYWSKYVCRGATCGYELIFLSLVVWIIVDVILFLLLYILTRNFQEVVIKDRRKIKLPELRLLFFELESLQLAPIVFIGLGDELPALVILLAIEPSDKFFKSLL